MIMMAVITKHLTMNRSVARIISERILGIYGEELGVSKVQIIYSSFLDELAFSFLKAIYFFNFLLIYNIH